MGSTSSHASLAPPNLSKSICKTSINTVRKSASCFKPGHCNNYRCNDYPGETDINGIIKDERGLGQFSKIYLSQQLVSEEPWITEKPRSLSSVLGACRATSFTNALLSQGGCLLGQNTQGCLTSYGQSGTKQGFLNSKGQYAIWAPITADSDTERLTGWDSQLLTDSFPGDAHAWRCWTRLRS